MSEEQRRQAVLDALGAEVLTRDQLESRLQALGAAEAINEIVPMLRAGQIAGRSLPCSKFWNWRLVSDDMAFSSDDC